MTLDMAYKTYTEDTGVLGRISVELQTHGVVVPKKMFKRYKHGDVVRAHEAKQGDYSGYQDVMQLRK